MLIHTSVACHGRPTSHTESHNLHTPAHLLLEMRLGALWAPHNELCFHIHPSNTQHSVAVVVAARGSTHRCCRCCKNSLVACAAFAGDAAGGPVAVGTTPPVAGVTDAPEDACAALTGDAAVCAAGATPLCASRRHAVLFIPHTTARDTASGQLFLFLLGLRSAPSEARRNRMDYDEGKLSVTNGLIGNARTFPML